MTERAHRLELLVAEETMAGRRDSDFFSDANKIKELAFRILVKIAQGHQKGHQKIPKELTIVNNVLIKFVYRKKGRTSILPALNGAVLL